TIQIIDSSKSDPILEAADYYLERRLEGKRGIGQDAPTGFVQEARWKRIVFDPNGRLKTKSWVLCLTDKLRTAFRQGSLEIEGARQYRSLNSDLIPWPEWKSMEIKENLELPFTYSAEKIFNALSDSIKALCGGFNSLLNLDSPPAQIDKKNRLHLTKLEKQEVPESVKALKKQLHQRMPRVSLPEILAQVDKFVGYSAYFTRLSSGDSIQLEGAASPSFYALILASACNISLTKMAGNPGLNVSLLENLREDILRPQTIQPAIASLVEFYSRLPLAQIWGEGGTSSSDGQGFAAAGHPLGAVYHRQRFRRRRRGFIVYTHILDNYAPFYTQVIPASAREAIYVLDGLLYHALSLMPREHYTDSHGYTDIVFALTYLLGFRLAPRMARFPDLTLWYGKGYEVEFRELFHGRITLESIASQWEAIQRICATIQNGRTRASQIIRKVSAFNRKHSLFKGLRNFGRLVRTRHILEIAGDKEYRKRILQGNNKGESRNALAKDLRYARQGVIREKDPDMRLCVVSAINLMILSLAI
ncbi:MAG: Tn3 family transposase, partial [Desulfobacteraceae bacterium]